jgi:hypothetical protein
MALALFSWYRNFWRLHSVDGRIGNSLLTSLVDLASMIDWRGDFPSWGLLHQYLMFDLCGCGWLQLSGRVIDLALRSKLLYE